MKFDIENHIANINKQLEDLGLHKERVDLRPELPVFIVMYEQYSDIGYEPWAVYSTLKEAEKDVKLYNLNDGRYYIEEMAMKVGNI